MVVEQTEGGAPEDVGVELLLSVLILEGLLPLGGGEFEDAAARPAGKQAEEIAQVGPRLDVVELATGQQGDEGGVDLACIVAPDEEPVLAADRLAPQGAFGPIVVQGEATVIEEALQGNPLIEGVPDRLGGRRLVERAASLLLAPGEECVDDGFDSARRVLSRSSGAAAAHARSTPKRPPMNASALRARSGSVSSAFHQYRRAWAQHSPFWSNHETFSRVADFPANTNNAPPAPQCQ